MGLSIIYDMLGKENGEWNSGNHHRLAKPVKRDILVMKEGIFVRMMAVDLGLVRTGLAVCDAGEILASPLCTIEEGNPEKVPQKVWGKAKEERVEAFVVGLPKNMDGSRGESAVRAEKFAEKLREISGLPVDMWDERMTTMSAIGFLNETDIRGKKRKAVIDAVSASIILQNYIERRKG